MDESNYSGMSDDLVDYNGPDGGGSEDFTDYYEMEDLTDDIIRPGENKDGKEPPLPPNGRPPPQNKLPPQLSRYPPVPLYPATGVPSPVPQFFPRNVHPTVPQLPQIGVPGFQRFPGMSSPYQPRPVPQFQPQFNLMPPQRLKMVRKLYLTSGARWAIQTDKMCYHRGLFLFSF